MKTKACVIITYFGKLPQTIEAFMQSCKNNPEIQWLVFKDCEYKQLPINVRFIQFTMSKMKNLIEAKLKMKVALQRPYKMCDFRPAYGMIFQDYLEGFDFWGYGDLDVIYGKLSDFINDNIFDEYDKIYTCGHLSFVRNTENCNNIYKLNTANSNDYVKVFTNENSFIFDEYRGINEKLLKDDFKVYNEYQFADIDVIYKRFRVADKKTINLCFPFYPFKNKLPRNYDYQVFVWEQGRTYHIYKDSDGEINKRELSYVHYRRKISCVCDSLSKSNFVICDEGIIEYDDSNYSELIGRYNPFPGKSRENYEYFVSLKNSIITRLGKHKSVVNVVRFIKGKKRGKDNG